MITKSYGMLRAGFVGVMLARGRRGESYPAQQPCPRSTASCANAGLL
jgi:hypothetical protein